MQGALHTRQSSI